MFLGTGSVTGTWTPARLGQGELSDLPISAFSSPGITCAHHHAWLPAPTMYVCGVCMHACIVHMYKGTSVRAHAQVRGWRQKSSLVALYFILLRWNLS